MELNLSFTSQNNNQEVRYSKMRTPFVTRRRMTPQRFASTVVSSYKIILIFKPKTIMPFNQAFTTTSIDSTHLVEFETRNLPLTMATITTTFSPLTLVPSNHLHTNEVLFTVRYENQIANPIIHVHDWLIPDNLSNKENHAVNHQNPMD